MTVFLDTSVLASVFFEEHPHHAGSWKVFRKCNRESGYCAAHTLAEVYASLTRMPGKNRATPLNALNFLNDVRDRLSVIGLEVQEYGAGLEFAASLGIVGGAVYDALLAHCALKSGADLIYTWNVRDFARCGQEVLRRLRTPDEALD